jgi:hypothetical protein
VRQAFCIITKMSQWEEDFPDDEVEDSTAKLSIESPKPAEAKVPTDSSKTDEAEVPGDIPKADEAKIPDEAEVPGDTPKADEAKIPADTPKAAEAEAPTEAPKAAIPPNSVSKDEKVENPTTSRSPKARGKAAEWPPKSKNEETQSTEEETGSKIATSEDILKKEEVNIFCQWMEQRQFYRHETSSKNHCHSLFSILVSA